MLAAIWSELARLRQPRILVSWFGLMALFSVMVNSIMNGVVASGPGFPPGAPGVAFPTLAELQSKSGIVSGLAAASSMFGVVTLSFWALITAQDYGSGLIRLLVAAQPRRLLLLAGKVAALMLVTAIATTVATVVDVAVAMPAAQAAGVNTSAWGTDLPSVVAEAWANLYAALLVWGVLGLAIGVLTRSAAVAISVGVGYVLVVETMIKMTDGAPKDWLLGTVLGALASGGTAGVAYGTALTLAAGYVTLGLMAAGLVVVRRDVTD